MGQFERQLVYLENGSVYKYAIHYLLLRGSPFLKSGLLKWALPVLGGGVGDQRPFEFFLQIHTIW